ncbi:translation initiation factor eIF3b [Schizosaccharomyces japonicus yFS275]|uniref:Eukaryotic translation initiation factor 3 subunit B n=1 Tax=Schizosaccharomyces japonicus (strain yFS275 / FY16936) TaxID=402676 RepID=B6K7M8_SCHJY|nr:translation initiation factor eIF3b [Schizosaccharomyces japonicus yFS275]EEB09532.1 translation initiation factor eIF3b [Schizosaccharomyces japonicus yFS275]
MSDTLVEELKDKVVITDEEVDVSDVEEKFRVPKPAGYDTIVVIQGAPVVDESKKKDFFRFLTTRVFAKIGKVKENGLYMPFNDVNGTSKSMGLVFADFENVDAADLCVQELDAKRIDKSHVFAVRKLNQLEKAFNTPEEFHFEEGEYHEREHLRSWLADYYGRDQFISYAGNTVTVNWNRKSDVPEQVVSRENWTETYVQWSPLGTYLVSLHLRGIQLWGGASWKMCARFLHPYVKFVDFSPSEKYLVSYSYEVVKLPPIGHPARETMPFSDADEGKNCFIWDVQSGRILRSFKIAPGGDVKDPKKVVWPIFKWSANDKYLARMTPGQSISVYETPSMALVDKKVMKIEGVQSFEWCPVDDVVADKSEQLLAYWTPELQNQPARVALVSIPSKATVRTKNLFNVSDCKLYWQSHGDYMCVKVDRHTKTKKSTFSNLEIFRVREKNTPVEVIDLKEVVLNFAWEPKSDRFAIFSANDQSLGSPNLKTNLSFYGLEKKKNTPSVFRHIATFEKKSLNSLFMNPKGRFLAAATLGSSTQYDLEFYDMDFESEKKENENLANIQLIGSAEHFGMTDIEWDPSGRYLTTSSTIWRHKLENGYRICDFKGTTLREELVNDFKQFIWRPRPPSPLTKEEMKKVRKQLKEYNRLFDEEDIAEKSSANRELAARRRRLIDDWEAYRQKVTAQVAEERKALGQTGVADAASAEEVIEETIEEVVSEEIIPVDE